MKITCPECGFEDEGNFCTNCGAPLKQVELAGKDSQIPPFATAIDGNLGKGGFGQLAQSRSAVVTTVIVIFLIDILSIITLALLGTNSGNQTLPSNFNIYFSAALDLFLGINLLRGRNWARTWILIRCVGGIIIWGIVLGVQGDYGSLFMNTGALLAVIILLSGISARLRLVGGVVLAVVATLGGIVWNAMGSPVSLPTTIETTSIPKSFLTYTSEGFFSISYPPDWSPEMSLIGEFEEQMKSYLADVGLEQQSNEQQMVFYGGRWDEINTALVVVQVEPKPFGSLENIIENTHQWNKENTDQYLEHSRVRTTIGGRQAVIQTYEFRDVDGFLLGQISAYVSTDRFIWTTSCVCEVDDLNENLSTFDQIVRSLRVEY